MTSGLVHTYHFDQSISNFRGFRWFLFWLFYAPTCRRANIEDPGQMPRSMDRGVVTGYDGLHLSPKRLTSLKRGKTWPHLKKSGKIAFHETILSHVKRCKCADFSIAVIESEQTISPFYIFPITYDRDLRSLHWVSMFWLKACWNQV